MQLKQDMSSFECIVTRVRTKTKCPEYLFSSAFLTAFLCFYFEDNSCTFPEVRGLFLTNLTRINARGAQLFSINNSTGNYHHAAETKTVN